MSNTIVLFLKISSIAAFVSLAQWILVYNHLEDWRESSVGRSLVMLAVFAMVTPLLFILSLFFNLSRATSQALAWIEIITLFLIAATMIRRSFVWIQIARRPPAQEIPEEKEKL